MRKYIFFLATTLCFIYIYGQTESNLNHKLDSIHTVVKNRAIENTNLKSIYSFIGQHHYPQQSKAILLLILKKSIENKSSNLDLSNASYALANYYYFNANTDSSFYYIDKADKYLKTENNPLLKSSILMTKGGIFKRKGKVILANNKLLQALKILNSIDTLKLSYIDNKKRRGKLLILYNSLAIFNKENNNYNTAIDYYNKAFNITQELKALGISAIILSNEGDLYIKTKQFQKALIVLKKKQKNKTIH